MSPIDFEGWVEDGRSVLVLRETNVRSEFGFLRIPLIFSVSLLHIPLSGGTELEARKSLGHDRTHD